jgi:membrane protein YdbS with pleckstrin-like domain
VELSGLIFVALAVVWAVVLIPKALRHHDEAARTRALDTVSEDARVLARREVAGSREPRLVVEKPRVPSPRTESPVLPTVPAPRRPVDRKRLATTHKAAAAAAARRRRRVLAVLLLATAVVGAGSYFGTLQPWAAAIPGVLAVGFLGLARVLVRREHARWQHALAGLKAAQQVETVSSLEPASSVELVETTVTAADPVDAPEAVIEVVEERNEQGFAVVSGLDDTASFPVGLLADPVLAKQELWDPVPVTLPTYVTKPRATRSVRTIDLNEPGVASSGRNAADSALVAEAATATHEPDDQRAVGT